jgi:VCBS repeat-containing protein
VVAAAAALALSTGAVALVAAPAGAAEPPAVSDPVAEQIAAIAAEKATRTPAERKVDSNLLYAAREAAGHRAVDGAPQLRSTVEPRTDGTVEVDLTATVGDGLLRTIRALGGTVVNASPAFDGIRARVPVTQLVALAGQAAVRSIRPAERAMTSRATGGDDAIVNAVGSGLSEADVVHGADTARASFGLSGVGVKVCVLSNGVASLADRQATGDLPAVSVLAGQAGSGDEGTAMLELIHDIAPGAELGFATGTTGAAQFATNIVALRSSGCDVLVDDITYPSEPAFQDGPIAQAVTQVRNDGALYISAAGNGGNLADGTSGTWQGDWQDAGPSQSPLVLGLRLHGWGNNVGYNTITRTGGPLNLQWADPMGGSANDYDLYLLNGTGLAVIASSTNVQNGSQDPVESIGSSPVGYRVVVTKPVSAAARYLVLYTNKGGLTYATGGNGRGHNVSVDALSIAATPAADPYQGTGPTGPYPGTFTSSALSEPFSADGPTKRFFTPAGVALTPGNFSATGGVNGNGPDLAAADGVITTTPGYTRFYGTSAAAPNAAGLAALAWEAKPSATPLQIENALGATATDIDAPGYDTVTGAGVIMAPPLMTNLGATAKAHVSADTRSVTPQTGDGDAYLEPGETATITQKLRSDGAATATGITAQLTSDSAYATVTQDSVAYPDLAVGATGAPNTLPLRISVAAGCPCGTSLPFTLTVTYGGGSQPTEVIHLKVPVGQLTTPTAYPYAGSPVAIPDNDPTGASASVSVPTSAPVSGVTLSIDGSSCTTAAGATTVGLDHTYVDDLRLILTSPSGTQVVLMDGTGWDGNNLCQTLFSDGASTSIQGLTASAAPFTGSFQPYSPLAAFIGEDGKGTWTLRAVDSHGSDTGSIRAFTLRLSGYNCNALNTAPVANGDSYTVGQGQLLEVAAPGVLGNDTDANADPLTAQLQGNPTHGSVTLAANGSFTYSPSGSYHGGDLFSYKAYDSRSLSPAATVSITVNGTPTPVADAYVARRGTALAVAAPGVLGNDTDPEGDPMTAVVVNSPSHGTLTLAAGGSFTYIPTAGYSGPDSFTYRAADGFTQSSPQTVSLTVNDAPAGVADSYRVTTGQTLLVGKPGVLGNDTDAEGDALSASLVGTVAHGTLTLNADGSFGYTPAGGYTGADSFTYRAVDATGQSAPTTASITVDPVNPPPTAVADAYFTPRNTALVVAAPGVLGNDSDPASEPITAAKASDPAHGTVALAADGSFTYTPTTGYSGTDSFTYRASDGTSPSAPQTVTITVNGAPTATADAYAATSGAALSVVAPGVLGNDADPEGDALTAQKVTDPGHGTVSLSANGSFTYTPAGGYTGPDSFTYRAKDATGQSAPATVSITVNAANVAPTANPDSYTTAFGATLTVAAPGLLGNDTDPEGSPLSAAKASNPSHGTVTVAADGSFAYTPAGGYSGPDSFTYRASDGQAQSAPQTVSITVSAAPNHAPVAVADGYQVGHDTPLVVAAPGVLGNDTDSDGDALTAQLVTGVGHGSIALGADGSFTYTPTTGYSGADSFTYRAKDGSAQSTAVTVSLTVAAPPNAAPTGTGDSYRVVTARTLARSAPGLLANDSDPDGDALSAAKVAGPTHGTVTVSSSGAFTYAPAAGFTGADSFTYRVSDGALQSSPVTVDVLVVSPTAAYVDAVYGDFLSRTADAGGMSYWGSRLDSGRETRTSFVLKMSRSHEYGVKVVTRAFQDVLGRNPDPSGREYWANRVQKGMPVAQLVLNLIASNEFLSHTGGTTAGFVDAIFQAILGRAPSSAERSARVSAIAAGTKRLQVATDLYNTAESRRRRVRVQFLDLLGRQPTTTELNDWVTKLATRSDIDLAIALGASNEYYAASQAL